jgi:predicted transcriptional regulator
MPIMGIGDPPTKKFTPYNIRVSSCTTTNVDVVYGSTDLKYVANNLLIKGYSSMPVVSEVGSPTALITKRHIISLYHRYIHEEIPVSDVMNRSVVGVDLFDKITLAESKMKGTGYNSLIVTFNDRFIGLITAKDMARAYFMLRKTSLASQFDHRMKNILAADLVNRNIFTLGPHENLVRAVDIILKTTQNVVPIIEDNIVVGVVSRRNIIRLLLDRKLL